MTGADAPDPDGLREWLSDELAEPVEKVEVELLPAGYANGAWRLGVETAAGSRAMVLKAPRQPSVVHALDPCREARVVDALGRAGAPVPTVLARDDGTRAMGRPCFVMEWVDGRSVPDDFPLTYHGEGWYRDASATSQRAIWDSFHDALAALHRVDPDAVRDAYDGPTGAEDVLAYWRGALLDVVDVADAPRHLAAFDWLEANMPASAEGPLAVCMGDARLVNGIVGDDAVRALVDFEVVYLGNPLADVGYSLFLERGHRAGNDALPGIPSEDETWARWSAATGRPLVDLEYWTAYAATIIVITAARATAIWAGSFSEDAAGLLPGWEHLVQEAGSVSEPSNVDEQVHPFDPAVWSWNESWYFSWIDLDGGAAGFFRLGLLPNQDRALIWSYVFHDGVWFGTEETRLRYDDFDLTDGVAYDRYGLRFGWQPAEPAASFSYHGIVREVTGDGAGGFVPIALDLDATPTTERFGTGTGSDLGSEQYPASRFEQSTAVTGTVRIGDDERSVRAAGHRDRSWGPRNWRVTFTLGDLQSKGAQLYFVGAPQLVELGGGYLRDASGVRSVRCVAGTIDYDDDARTIAPTTLRFVTADGDELDVEIVPASPSISFDMAHTCEDPEHWLYWRILVDAKVSGWTGTPRGWVEANRYGIT